MSNFDAVYGAAIQCFRGDYSSIFERAVSEAFSSEWWRVQQEFANAAVSAQEPHVLMRPRVFVDGDKWCALYGDNLQDGVAGFGESPAEAAANFSAAWYKKLPSREAKP